MRPEIMLVVISIIIATFVVTAFSRKETDIKILDNFKSETKQNAAPILRNFPSTNFQTEGPKLQLGAFSKLEGAETLQTEMSEKGIVAHVEKKVDSKGLLYAVVIEPKDENEHSRILGKLRENNLNYFHVELSNRVQPAPSNEE